MPDDPGSIWYIVLVLALIGVNAFFAMSEIAIISLNDAKLHHDAENGDKKAKKLCRLVSEPNNFLATIQVAITLAGLLSSAFAADKYAGYLTALAMKVLGGAVAEESIHAVVLVLFDAAALVCNPYFRRACSKKNSYALSGANSLLHKWSAFVLL